MISRGGRTDGSCLHHYVLFTSLSPIYLFIIFYLPYNTFLCLNTEFSNDQSHQEDMVLIKTKMRNHTTRKTRKIINMNSNIDSIQIAKNVHKLYCACFSKNAWSNIHIIVVGSLRWTIIFRCLVVVCIDFTI